MKLYSSREIIRVLERLRYSQVSQKGSHLKLRKLTPEGTKTVMVRAGARQGPIGTFNSILGQAGSSREEFEKALR